MAVILLSQSRSTIQAFHQAAEQGFVVDDALRSTATLSALFLNIAARTVSLIRQILLPSPFPGVGRYAWRLLTLGLALPVILAVQFVHWIGFLCDELFYRGYRRVDVREPVFVLGVPRSGTTFTHRLLAEDTSLTTLSTWECLFAPSVSQRRLVQAAAGIDRRVGRPLGRLVGLLEARVSAWMEDLHPTSLAAPEEDYFVFMPLLACFLLVVPFPEADWLWRMARFDDEVPEHERLALRRWYRRCLQRHLYVHGEHKTMLSKNAAFAGMTRSLIEEFPDCRIVVCERDAIHAAASQFRSLADGMKLFGTPPDDERFHDRLVQAFAYYYANLDRAMTLEGQHRMTRLALWSLSRDTRRAIHRVQAELGLDRSPAVDAAIADYETSRRGQNPVSKAPERCPPEWEALLGAWRQPEQVRL